METQETAASPEPVTSSEATQAPEADQPTEESVNLDDFENEPEQEQPDEGQAPVEDDSEEVEWEGKAFKAPKGVKDSLLRQADYTKKTMALAEQQKAWASSIEANRAFTRDVGKIMTMDEQLAQYANVDWQSWYASDPNAAQAARFNLQVLKDERDNMARSIEHRAREQEAKTEQEFATRIERDLASLSKPDPTVGWDGKFTPEVKSKLENVARSLGYTEDRLSRADATDVKALHLMSLGMEVLKQRNALSKQPITEANPVPKVSRGRSNDMRAGIFSDDMDAYVKARANGAGGGRYKPIR